MNTTFKKIRPHSEVVFFVAAVLGTHGQQCPHTSTVVTSQPELLQPVGQREYSTQRAAASHRATKACVDKLIGFAAVLHSLWVRHKILFES